LEKVKTVIIEAMMTKKAFGKSENGHHRGYDDQNAF